MEIADSLSWVPSLSIGTVSKMGFPAFARLWGFRYENDNEMIVLLPKVSAERTLKNLRENKKVAINCADMITNSTIQFKGEVTNIQEANEMDLEMARTHRNNGLSALEQGYSPELVKELKSKTVKDGWTITIRYSEAYDQTPGGRAGTKIFGI